jgi:Na+/H+-dicarboxylate symporter
MSHMKLIIKLAFGMMAGILLGLFAPEGLIRVLLTFQGLFGQCLSFIIPLFIFFFITDGIAGLDAQAGKLLGLTTGVAYLSTLGAGLMAAAVGLHYLPSLALGTSVQAAQTSLPTAFFTLELPPVMGITTALLMAFLFGLGITNSKATVLRQATKEGKSIIEGLVYHALIPALPFYIASLFASMALSGEVIYTVKVFGLVLMLAVALHIVWLTVLYGMAGAIAQINPFKAFRTMLPAYVTALGTMSSVATLPVTLEQTLMNGVDEDVADFTIPLCATMHMAGSTITITTAAIAVSILVMGAAPTWNVLIPFVAMLGVMMIASPGVPGGSVMAALGILASILGFNEAALALMITLYIAQDSFGTACNVTGDGAVALIVNRLVQDPQPLDEVPDHSA